jgi:hypothetical protein
MKREISVGFSPVLYAAMMRASRVMNTACQLLRLRFWTARVTEVTPFQDRVVTQSTLDRPAGASVSAGQTWYAGVVDAPAVAAPRRE